MKTSLRRYLSFVMVLCVAFVCFIGGANVKAATVASSVDFTTASASHSAYTDKWSYGEWTVSGGANNTGKWAYVKMGGKKTNLANYSDIYIASPAVAAVTEKVEVNIISGSVAKTGMTATMSVHVYSDSEYSTEIDATAEQTITNAAQLFVFEPNKLTSWPANSYFKVIFTVTNTSTTNGIVWLDNISIYAQSADPSVSITNLAYAMIGSPVTLDANVKNSTSDVVWSISEGAQATIANGVLTPAAMETITVKAALADDAEVSDDLTINVFPSNASEMTIAEVLAICDFVGGSAAPYKYTVTGEIVSIDTVYSSQYGNISVTINDGTGSIQAFRLVGGEDLSVGKKIKVTGAPLLYTAADSSTTYELAEGCTYVEVLDATETLIQNALNDVYGYMSLGYKYSVATQVVAAADAVVSYSGSTTNMIAEENNATLVGLDAAKFIVSTDKKSSSTEVGLNQAGVIRLYSHKANATADPVVEGGDGTELIITTADSTNIAKVVISFNTTVGAFTVNGVAGSKEVTEYAINANSVIIKNTDTDGTQLHINSIEIYLEGSTKTETKYSFSNVEFRVRFGVDDSVADIANVESYGFKVTAAGTDKLYDATNQYWKEDTENGVFYAVISLGDLLNNPDRLDVKFSVQAYATVGETYYYSSQVKEYTMAELVKTYYEDPATTDIVADLYNALVAMGKIA